jgi:hypothetical protein
MSHDKATTATLIPPAGTDGRFSIQFHVDGLPLLRSFDSKCQAQQWCHENGLKAVSPSWVASMKGSS